MKIRIPSLPEGVSRIESEEPPEALGLDGRSGPCALTPVSCAFDVQMASSELIVKGEIRTVLELECRRCGVFFSTNIVDSSFLRAYEIVEDQTVDVDVTGDLREAVLLQVPPHPLCGEACRGLCPQCGRNLNEGVCSCTEPDFPGAWSELDKLKLDEGNGGKTP